MSTRLIFGLWPWLAWLVVGLLGSEVREGLRLRERVRWREAGGGDWKVEKIDSHILPIMFPEQAAPVEHELQESHPLVPLYIHV